jgi:hypothetical protein
MTTFTYTDPDGHVLRISPHPGTQAEVLLTIQGPHDGLMVGVSVPAAEAAPVIAAISAIAAVGRPVTDQPQPLADRIAAALAGHTANISNGDGTVICNCGTTVRANGAAWREHRADTVLAIVQPDLDARDAEIRRLTADVDLWRRTVTRTEQGRDRAIADNYRLTAELQQAQQRNAAVLALLPADPAEDINAPFIPLRRIRAAATGQPAPSAVSGA